MLGPRADSRLGPAGRHPCRIDNKEMSKPEEPLKADHRRAEVDPTSLLARELAPALDAMPSLPHCWEQVRRLYLDQQQWIRLAKGDVGKDAEARQLFRLISNRVSDGLVVVPLSQAHWAETWHRGEWRSRWHLANVMWQVSRLVALAPFHGLIEREIDLELHRRLGRPAWPQKIKVVDVGVNHAWASGNGRLRYVEWADGRGGEGKKVQPPVAISSMKQPLYEWMSLAGPPDDMRIEGLDLGEHRRAGENWARWEEGIAVSLGDVNQSERAKWVAFSLFQEIWKYVLSRCDSIGTKPEIAIGRGLLNIDKFLRAMPITDCLLRLRILRHQNPAQRWVANDRLDLLALAVAIPYCQVVVTERQWTHLVKRAKLDEKYGTLVTNSLAEGTDFLLTRT
jgi:hypothetical protein